MRDIVVKHNFEYHLRYRMRKQAAHEYHHASASLWAALSPLFRFSHLRKKLKKPLPFSGRGAISIGT